MAGLVRQLPYVYDLFLAFVFGLFRFAAFLPFSAAFCRIRRRCALVQNRVDLVHLIFMNGRHFRAVPLMQILHPLICIVQDFAQLCHLLGIQLEAGS